MLALLAIVAAGFTAPLAAQSVGNGTLLVASPGLTDPNFARAVILVLRNDNNGTLGVVLNRPTNLELATAFPELAAGVGAYEGRLFRGGPISPVQPLLLVRGLAAATIATPEILDKVFLTVDLDALPDMVRLADGTNDLRIYAGHAAWGPGQLDAELRAGGWQVVPGTADLVFHADPGGLWTELEGRGTTRSDLVASLSDVALLRDAREVGVEIEHGGVAALGDGDGLVEGRLRIELHVGDELFDDVVAGAGPHEKQRSARPLLLAFLDAPEAQEQRGTGERGCRRALDHLNAVLDRFRTLLRHNVEGVDLPW